MQGNEEEDEKGKKPLAKAIAVAQMWFLWNIKSSYHSWDKADLISMEFQFLISLCCLFWPRFELYNGWRTARLIFYRTFRPLNDKCRISVSTTHFRHHPKRSEQAKKPQPVPSGFRNAWWECFWAGRKRYKRSAGWGTLDQCWANHCQTCLELLKGRQALFIFAYFFFICK